MKQPELPYEFLESLQRLEEAYLSQADPIKQSGFYGGEIRWRSEREIILEAVRRDGDFLDVGCANGFLLECLMKWAMEKGLTINPFGVDQGAALINMARERFIEKRDQFWVGNAWDWVPPRKFDYVYTLADNVPEQLISDYVRRLLANYVTEGGSLIVGAYGISSKGQPAVDVADLLLNAGLQIIGESRVGDLPLTHVAWTVLDNSSQPE